MPTYRVDIDVLTNRDPEPDELDVLLTGLQDFGAAISTRDTHLGLTLSVSSEDILGATHAGLDLLTQGLPDGLRAVSTERVEAATEQARAKELAEPVIPPLVGYAEIAEIAGVSRQRARQLAEQPGFPVPVTKTAAGPLRVRAAVEDWAATRRTKPGRPNADERLQVPATSSVTT